PIIPAERWKPIDPLNPGGRIILLLVLTVGLPYFALATTAPLLQAWVARVDPRVAPYRLYALSNFASLLALVSYPFVIEPLLSRRQQAWTWSGLFAVFAIGCAYCAVRAARSAPITPASMSPPEPPASLTTDPARIRETAYVESIEISPTPLTRVLWVALPACASALLLGTSNTLTQDVAPVPFLWVLPLALYLLTFVLAFDHPRWYSRRVVGPLMILATCGMLWAMYQPLAKITLGRMLLIYNAGLFIACLMCHGELARLRPHARRLTGYYLAISAGGALGGAFVSIVAPLIFTRFLELGISLWACCALILLIVLTDPNSRLRGLRPPVVWVGLICGMVVLAYAVWANEPSEKGTTLVARMRNFYGVLRVQEWSPEENPNVRLRSLQHGRTTHGLQALAPPALRRKPLSYYGKRSGVGVAIGRLDDLPRRHIGVVGLGVGSISALARPGDRIRFYEIDPNVLHVARTWFTYLADSPAQVDVVLGDGRLSLERESSQQFDLLVLDAFSSDAIPVHLLTREAFAIYRKHVREGGIFAIHISNRHLDLTPVVAGLAQAFGLRMFLVSPEIKPGEGGEYSSTWAILGSPSSAAPPAPPAPPDHVLLWTDDRASVLEIMQGPPPKKE
ncbi:MAG: fused MFS/spermidine synthase, partial [Planctomycetota bacterium]|nr:fused MFS/spermidine synthase [Planctomycetota bacterium]